MNNVMPNKLKKKERVRVITPRDIANVVEWKSVEKAIKYFYPNDRGQYLDVYEQIRDYKKRAHNHPGEVIELSAGHIGTLIKNDEEDMQEFLENFCGTIELCNDEMRYSMATNLYSMSFRSWKELANIPLSRETLDHYTFPDILAHFIWEITFYGDESSSKKIAKGIQKSVEAIKKGKAKTEPFNLDTVFATRQEKQDTR